MNGLHCGPSNEISYTGDGNKHFVLAKTLLMLLMMTYSMAITLTYAQLTELYVKQYKSGTSQLTQRTANILKNPLPSQSPGSTHLHPYPTLSSFYRLKVLLSWTNFVTISLILIMFLDR